MKPLCQAWIALSDDLLNVLAPAVAIRFEVDVFQLGIGRFEFILRGIELDLLCDRNLAPVILGSRHCRQHDGRPPFVFPGAVALFERFPDVLGRLP